MSINRNEIITKDHLVLNKTFTSYKIRNTTIRAYKIPRIAIETILKSNSSNIFHNKELYNEFYRPYTYVLYDEYGRFSDRIYIGHSGTTKGRLFSRLIQHVDEDEKIGYIYHDKWDTALVFMQFDEDNRWDKQVEWYERELVRIAPHGMTYNKPKPNVGDVNHPPKDLDQVMDIMKKCLEYVGVTVYNYEAVNLASKTKLSKPLESDVSTEKIFEINGDECNVCVKHTYVERIDTSDYCWPEYRTPPDVAIKLINMLPPETWEDTSNKKIYEKRFIDITSRDGIFLYLIREKLLKESKSLKRFLPDREQRYNYITNNMIYALTTSENAANLTRKALYGNQLIKGNVHYIRDIVDISKQTKNQYGLVEFDYTYLLKNEKTMKLRGRATEKKIKFKYDLSDKILSIFNNKAYSGENKEMKFDVVISNPPYQDESGHASVYDKFVDLATKLSDNVAMITRDNWISGKDFKNLRDNLTEDGSIMEIVHYPKIGEVFADIQVAVAYFRWERGAKQQTKYTRILNGQKTEPKYLNISDGLIFKSDIGERIINKVGGLSDWNRYYQSRGYAFMEQRKYNKLKEDCSMLRDEYYNVKVISNKYYEPDIYVSIDNFSKIHDVEKYKVQCGVVINEALENKPGNVLTNIMHLPPNAIGSHTWALVAVFDTLIESVNCEKYIKTKFVRFLANQTVDNRSNVTDNTFKFVPVQDFTVSSDIDWSQPIASIDKQLYKKYSLSVEEINHIEKTIKPMI